MLGKNISKIALLAALVSGACVLAGCATSVGTTPQQTPTSTVTQPQASTQQAVHTTTRAS